MSLRALRRACSSLLAAAVMTGAGTLAVAVVPTAAYAESSYSMESQFVAQLNAARQANGLQSYAVAGDLASIARQHSQSMASKQSLYHNPSLTSEVQNWQAVGENVGEGPSVSSIHQAFMNSPEHRANILDHDFTQVGVGVVVDKNGVIWVTEDFRQPMSGGTSHAVTQHSHHSQSVSHPSTSSAGRTSAPARSAGHAPTAATATAVPSPRAALLHRLHQLRHQAVRRASDPVAQSFDYVATLSRLTA